MPKKIKPLIEEEINDFFFDFGSQGIVSFLRDSISLFELYDIEDENDWVEKQIEGDEEYIATIRVIRTVYLISRIAEFHAGKLCMLKVKYPNLWKRMEICSLGKKEISENL